MCGLGLHRRSGLVGDAQRPGLGVLVPIYIYICMYVCMYIYIYIYVYIYSSILVVVVASRARSSYRQ